MTPEARADFASALAFEDQGRADEALRSYAKALSADPAFEDALHNRGLLLARLGRLADAELSHREYVAICPTSLRARQDLADVLLSTSRYEEALEQLDRVLVEAPAQIPALVSRGLALSALGRFGEARETFQRALSSDLAGLKRYVSRVAPGAALDVLLSPESTFLWRRYVAQHACDWRAWSEYIDVFARIAADSGIPLDPSIAFMAFHLPLSARQRLDIARSVAGRFERAVPALPHRKPSARAKIRIGLLSPDLQEHVNAYLLLPLFELLDRERFELYAYSLSRDDASAIGGRLRGAADRFVELQSVDDDQAASIIRRDEIDVLLDVGGYTTGGRFGIVARRPAPLQVSYLGFAGSLGSARVDYAIVDPVIAPAQAATEWSEALVLLPHTYYLYDFRESPSVAVSRREYGLPEDAFVYCAFHKAEKITPDAFDLWMRVLRRVPTSVLWLLQLPAAQENLRALARARGIDPARLHFAPFDPRGRYLARQRLGDLMLDTLHHSAMTTACDALGAGLPILTWKGSSMASRACHSILKAAALPELVTEDAAELEELAVRLSADKNRLHDLRRKVTSNRHSTPLFDTAARLRYLESAFERMHRRALAGDPPAPFEIAA